MSKVLIMAFVASIVTITGCKKEDPSDIETCPKPSVEVSNMQGGRTAQIYSNGGDMDYSEVEYGPTGFTRGSGTTVTTGQYTLLTGLANGIYDIYGRVNCGGADWSDWSDVESFVVNDADTTPPVNPCASPYGLSISQVGTSNPYYRFEWEYPSGANYYQVEYGPTGFAHGAGTLVTVNFRSYSDGEFLKNTTYDYYVRSNCGGSSWSDWAGPKSFMSEYNVNTCLAPTDLVVSRVSGGTLNYSFDANGETTGYELYVNLTEPNPNSGGTLIPVASTSGTITVANSSIFCVYARSTCSNGSKTDWSQPTIVF